MRLPHDPEAEMTVVAATCFGNADAMADAVSPADFFDPDLSALYVAALDLHGAGESPRDVFQLRQRCPHVQPDKVTSVLSAFTSSGGLYHSSAARIVVDHAARRRVMQAAGRAVEGLSDITSDTEQVTAELARAVADAGNGMTPAPFGPDVDTFLDIEVSHEWVVPDLIERGDRVILTGGEGKGKSTLLRQMAVQVAAGVKPFTNTRKYEPRRVLLIDCENSAAQVQRKLAPLRDLVDMDPHNLVVLVRNEGLDLTRPGDKRWVEERVVANRPDVVMTGPLYKLSDADPNEEKPARALAAYWDRLRVRYGFALVLEAHSPHPQGNQKRVLRPYGASLWKRWPEFGIGLDDTGKSVKLAHWRGQRDERSGWPKTLVRGGHWPWLWGPDE